MSLGWRNALNCISPLNHRWYFISLKHSLRKRALSNNFPCLHAAGNPNLPNPQMLHFKVMLREKILKRTASLSSWFKTSLAYFQYTYGVTFKEKSWNNARLHTGKSCLQRELKFIIWALGRPCSFKMWTYLCSSMISDRSLT